MKNTKYLALAGCTLAALLGGACTGSGYLAAGTTPTSTGTGYATAAPVATVGPRWQDPTFFRGRIEERLGRIEQRVRGDITAGVLPAEAINDFHMSQSRIEQYLSQAALDGVIDMGERQAVRDMVRGAAQLGGGRYGATPDVYGGGPNYTPGGEYQAPAQRSYFDSTWEWGL